MSDIRIDADANIPITDNDLEIVTGQEAIGQDIRRSIRVVKGEYFRDVNMGIDYNNEILIKGATAELISTRFRAEIFAVPGVLDIRGFNITQEGRAATITIEKIVTQEGTFPFEEVI